MRPSAPAVLLLALALGPGLSGCDQLGIPTPAAKEAKREADAKAIGGACRHAGRAIEDCYTLNKKAEKAAVYAGWREMNEYMRENNLKEVVPALKPEPKASAPATPASAASDAEGHDEADASGDEAGGDKKAKAHGDGADAKSGKGKAGGH